MSALPLASAKGRIIGETSEDCIGLAVNASHLIHTITQAIMGARYAPPKRRKSAWYEGYDLDLAQARRVAEAIVNALQASGYRISQSSPAPHHSTPSG